MTLPVHTSDTRPHDTERAGAFTHRIPASLAIALLVVLALSGCGHARLVHYDGEPFMEQGSRMALENGWVAVDSCATGRHAVVVVDVESFNTFPIVPRWINTGELGTMRDYRIDGPWCRTEYDGFYGEAYDDLPGRWRSESYYGEEHCVYRIRVEYTLDPPIVADSMYLAHIQDALPSSDQ